MRRNIRGRKLAVILTVAVLCLAGCGKEPVQDKNDGNVSGAIKLEDLAQENSKETTVTTVHSEQKDTEQEAEDTGEYIDFDVEGELEKAEEAAADLEKKLYEDDSLTQAEMNDLSHEIYTIWDDVLNDFWKALEENLDEETMEELLEEQRAWIDEKETEVKQAGEDAGGGSLAPLVADQKAAELTKERVYELASYLGFEER